MPYRNLFFDALPVDGSPASPEDRASQIKTGEFISEGRQFPMARKPAAKKTAAKKKTHKKKAAPKKGAPKATKKKWIKLNLFTKQYDTNLRASAVIFQLM